MLFIDHLLILLVSAWSVATVEYNCTTTEQKNSYNCDNLGLKEIPADLPLGILTLSLRNNLIRNITLDSLKNYNKLQHLNLENNVINEIGKNAFKKSTNLLSLNLASNNLTDFDFKFGTFAGLKLLQQLRLSFNGLNTLKSEAVYYDDLQSLETLDLSNNQLYLIDSNAFTDIDTLKTLLLQNNNLTTVDGKIFAGLIDVNHVDLSDNKLVTLADSAFAGLGLNLTLVLANNELTEIPDTVLQVEKQKRNIIKLDLSYNRLTAIPYDVITSTKVNLINEFILDGNPMVSLEPQEGGTTTNSVTSLSISNMPVLQNIDKYSLSPFVNLVSLNISNNYRYLKVIDKDALVNATNNISTIILKNNALVTLTDDLLPWQRMKIIQLAGNPWRCDCNVIWMKKVSSVVTQIRCTSPYSLRGRFLDHVPVSELKCVTPGPHALSVGVSILIAGIVVAVVGFTAWAIYTYRKKITERLSYMTLHDSNIFGHEAVAIYKDEKTTLTKAVDV